MALSDGLLAILVCPRCKGNVRFVEDKPAFVCDSCRLAYPVRDGIPVMLIDEAERL
ncbi:MAG TPA: Trm112 family protein [Geobacteraceae bacterium]|nr:Trm112 family protein [Geobacteraceae bacterium]